MLSGSYELPNAVEMRTVLGSDTILRCLCAADIYRRGKPTPVVVSGPGFELGGRTLSPTDQMSELLVKLGVHAEDVKLEARSRSSYENAVECRKLLDLLGIRKILLVTEATHMHRAALCFRKQGIEVLPAACHQRATDFQISILNFLPSPYAADGIADSIHEWLGLIWYRICRPNLMRRRSSVICAKTKSAVRQPGFRSSQWRESGGSTERDHFQFSEAATDPTTAETFGGRSPARKLESAL